MKYLIKAPEERLRASVQLPASKSISNRALILNALSYSPYDIQNLSDCDDTEVMVKALNSDSRDFDIKAAGTAMRFLTAFLSKIVGEWTITGTERMKNRPIKLLVDALNSLGARIEYIEKEGYPPFAYLWKCVARRRDLSGRRCQFAIYFSLIDDRPFDGKRLDITSGRKYHFASLYQSDVTIDGTVWGESYLERPNHQDSSLEYKPIRFTVESDWSAASYWYSMMALSKNAEIELLGLFKNSLQGDAAGAKLFAQLGVGTAFTDRGRHAEI